MESVRINTRDGVAVVQLDDGKVNALSPSVIAAVGTALDDAEKGDASALVLLGRAGRLSGGFDLGTLRKGAAEGRALVRAGGELAMRLYDFPKPVVVGCTGHAIAMGAILLLSADLRIGARGDFKIGLNEVAIGMTLPIFGAALARDRLSKRHFDRAVVHAELYAPDAAVDAGYLDRVVAPSELEAAALAEASRLGGLPQPAFGQTRRRAHRETVDHVLSTLDADLEGLLGGGGAGRSGDAS